jgi:dephospho-CoA kinase
MNKNIYKLAFTGLMGAGKTSTSLLALGIFTEKYGPDNSIGYVIQFANPLHQSAVAFHRREKPRTFLQRLGDLARREFGEDVFEKIFEENVEGLTNNRVPQLKQNHILLMTDDLRFLGEYNLLKRLGFAIIRVEADEELRKERIGPTFTNVKHRSETEMELFTPDFVISNNDRDPHMLSVDAQLRQLFSEHNLIGE